MSIWSPYDKTLGNQRFSGSDSASLPSATSRSTQLRRTTLARCCAEVQGRLHCTAGTQASDAARDLLDAALILDPRRGPRRSGRHQLPDELQQLTGTTHHRSRYQLACTNNARRPSSTSHRSKSGSNRIGRLTTSPIAELDEVAQE